MGGCETERRSEVGKLRLIDKAKQKGELLTVMKWTMPIPNWKAAFNQFVIMFGDRVPD